ncbi:MAG: hypothetical protein FWG88_00265 [Oscillospiraceae bacterium]|nr:hypothetical protein [Oscillospiraceae bacterium]
MTKFKEKTILIANILCAALCIETIIRMVYNYHLAANMLLDSLGKEEFAASAVIFWVPQITLGIWSMIVNITLAASVVMSLLLLLISILYNKKPRTLWIVLHSILVFLLCGINSTVRGYLYWTWVATLVLYIIDYQEKRANEDED